MPKNKAEKINQIKTLTKLNTLAKFRIAVITIFILMTLSIILAVVLSNQFVIAAALMLISYIAVLAIMVNLFTIKDL
jgi:hypothetical protein